MSENVVLAGIRELLDARGVTYRELEHAPTYTSEESARARGEELRIGGKALLMKGGDDFSLFVLPADRRIDSQAIRRTLSLKRLRFASADELRAMTGLTPGSVPPFGRPLLPFDLYVDSGICENERIAFNAGSLTHSIIMSAADYLAIAAPKQVFSFAIATPDRSTVSEADGSPAE